MTLLTTYWSHSDTQGRETTFLVQFTATPEIPGIYDQIPENCHPYSPPEVDIEGVYLHSTSTPESRTQSFYYYRFGEGTPPAILNQARKQLGFVSRSGTPWKTKLLYHCLQALASGGFIGPAQFHPRTNLYDLLSTETLDSIEAACFTHMDELQHDGPELDGASQ